MKLFIDPHELEFYRIVCTKDKINIIYTRCDNLLIIADIEGTSLKFIILSLGSHQHS